MKQQLFMLPPLRVGNSLRFLLLIMMAFLLSFDVQASHYRFGNISWSIPNPASPRTVSFKVQMAFRATFYAPTPTLGNTVPVGVNLDFGDATSTAPINLFVTSVNTTEDWFFGEATITHTYAGAATSFTASYLSNARISSLQNNANANFASFTAVTLTNPINTSPVTTSPPIVNVITGNAAATFQLAASDPENQALTFRFATNAEMGGGAQTQPVGMSVSASGLVTFNTVGKPAGNIYNAAFVVTDAAGASTMLDLLVRIVNSSTPPVFDYSVTPANATVYDIHPGQLLTFPVKAFDTDPGDNVTLNVVGAPGGGSFTPTLPTSGNPVTTTFSWTPTLADLGSRVMTFTAEDIALTQTTTSVTIIVSLNPVFDVPPTPQFASEQCIPPGVLHQETIKAHSPDANQNVTLNTTTSVSGATHSPSLPIGGANSVQTTMSWTPTASQFGDNVFTYTASDAFSHTTTHTFTLIVNSVPTFTSAPVTAATVGQPYTYHVVVNDPDIAYGDMLDIIGTMIPAWLTLTDNGDGTATLTGTPLLANIGLNHVQLDGEDIHHHCHGQVMQAFDINVIPCQITLSTAVTNVSCFGGSNGAINLTVNNAAAPVSYLWSNTKTTEDISGLSAGTYSVALTDAYGCTASTAATVTQPTTAVVAGTIAGQTLFCTSNTIFTGYGPSSLTLGINPSGGTPPYTYVWSPGGATTKTVSVSPAANTSYSVVVKDANGCTVSATSAVTVRVRNVRCGNNNDKVMVCHNGNNSICISPNAVPAHLSNHGDCLGDCSSAFARMTGGNNMEAGAVVVYPNPAHGTVKVELKSMGGTYNAYQIADINGRVVLSKELEEDTIKAIIDVDISTLVPGIYIIRAVTDQGAIMSRFSVN